MPQTSDKIRILIAEDHALVRRGLIALLDGHEALDVVGEAGDGQEAVNLAAELQPDVILMDLQMPRLDGVAAIETIKQQNNQCKILVITSYGDDDLVISAVKAGANGYLLKTTMPERLLSAISEVYEGGAPLDPAISDTVLRKISGRLPPEETLQAPLTKRELTVLQLVAKGYTDHKIGALLAISTRTVSTHVHSILNKLQVENRTQAALYALRHGYSDIEKGSD